MNCCWGNKSKNLTVINQQENSEISKLISEIGDSTMRFSLKELNKATNNFSTKLGIGELSTCYKGTLENGTVVAVKVIKPRNADMRMYIEFKALISMMSRIKHSNVVEFIGCCVEDDHVIIVYEFMEGGNLTDLLDGKISELGWPMRASVCLGIARGLECVHHGSGFGVVHRDIRPSNILLDSGFEPKVVDFGIAHVFNDYASDGSDRILKTIGYLDPEYMMSGIWSRKADVYAFGVIVLEVISGKRVPEFRRDGLNLVDWARQHGQDGSFLEIIDSTLSDFTEDEVKCFIDVALSCVRLLQNSRPSMSEVLLLLSGDSDFSKNTQNKPEQPC